MTKKRKKVSKMKSVLRRYSTGNPALDEKVEKLVRDSGFEDNASLIRELIVTALKIGEDGMDRGDMKMINIALKELRYGLKVFYPYQHTRKVAIFGSARTKKNQRRNIKLPVNLRRKSSRKGGW